MKHLPTDIADIPDFADSSPQPYYEVETFGAHWRYGLDSDFCDDRETAFACALYRAEMAPAFCTRVVFHPLSGPAHLIWASRPDPTQDRNLPPWELCTRVVVSPVTGSASLIWAYPPDPTEDPCLSPADPRPFDPA